MSVTCAPLPAVYLNNQTPKAQAKLKATPQDFCVTEVCNVEPDGQGEHVWLWVEKLNLNTQKLAKLWAECLGIPAREIGYSGLKDRHAVTTQWFSVPWPIKQPLEALVEKLQSFDLPLDDCYAKIIDAQRHSRKLRIGTHHANHFRITLRDVVGNKLAVEQKLNEISALGLSNYFGLQRFGFEGKNLELAERLFAGKKLRKNKRGFAISAVRAYVFNQILAARLADHSWNQVQPGEVVMLEGSESVFCAQQDISDLQDRANRFDIHPTAPLIGIDSKPLIADPAKAQEQQYLAGYQDWLAGLEKLKVQAARRALRVVVEALDWTWLDAQTLVINFELPRGSFATVLIRELCEY